MIRLMGSTDLPSLEKAINDKVEEGWQLLGPVMVGPHMNGSLFVATMERDDDYTERA
jgi:hypothetical protein